MKKFILSAVLCFSCFVFPLCAGAVPRPEYPRPQFERDAWVNLNGEWTFTLDQTLTGVERGLKDSDGFVSKITVPFCPESRLSGAGLSNSDFIQGIWYHRNLDIPASWEGKRVMLNFGAVYYRSEIYIDGRFVARHFGGSDSFSLDISAFVKAGGSYSLVVFAASDLRSRMQPAGKQSLRLDNFECLYTRTTGIWQTVWMEAVPDNALKGVRVATDIDRGTVSFTLNAPSCRRGDKLRTTVYDGSRKVASDTGAMSDGMTITLPIRNARLWSPASPFLYDVTFEVLTGGEVADRVKSYFGMRKIQCIGNRVYLNNEPFYQRLVLDQGFYPDGIWTAPSDDALRKDIELSMAAGFNGARLHQKVFEERFHYWADRLGYLTWGEFPSWGIDVNSVEGARNFICEWGNVVSRDANHPSIIVWTPLNEEFWPDEFQYPRFVEDVYYLTKRLDPTRPVNTISGGVCTVQDIWTFHSYVQDPEELWKSLWNGGRMRNRLPDSRTLQLRPKGNVGFNRPALHDNYAFPEYDGTVPYILDEWGGMKCRETNASDGNWGYGKDPETREDYYSRLEALMKTLVSHAGSIWGFCFTQLTDVEQEQNGIYYFDRREKFDMDRIRSIISMPLPDQTGQTVPAW